MDRPIAVPGLAVIALLTGCTAIQRMAATKVADVLAGEGVAYSADNDPDLIRGAAPFSLKLMESVLQTVPDHSGLLTASAGAFTQYAWAFVEQDADALEATNLDAAFAARDRARLLYLRARDYGLRALAVRHRGIDAQLREQPRLAVSQLAAADASPMYWTAVAWAAAISLNKDSAAALAELRSVDALLERLVALDPDYDAGALDTFLVTYTMARPGAHDPRTEAERYYRRALQLSRGGKAAPFLAYAEAVCVPTQDRAGFEAQLRAAIDIDADAVPAWRLENHVMQRRARWLLMQIDRLFLDAPQATEQIP